MTGATRDMQLSLVDGMDKPVGRVIESVFKGTNADLMAAVAPIYLTGSVLDTTYGAGKWWTRYRPDPFTYHDLATDGVDFRHQPHDDNSFDTVVFDPPYIPAGGQPTQDKAAFREAYGLGWGANYRSAAELRDLIRDGLTESARVAKTFLLVKCMEFVSSGFHDMPVDVAVWAAEAGWRKHDTIVHHGGTGPGGHNITTIKRARRAHSYLLVFTPDRRRKAAE